MPGPNGPTASVPFPPSAGFAPPPAVNSLAPDFPNGYAHQGSVALEGRVGGTDIAVRWVGSHGVNLVRKLNLNQPPPGPGPVDARRPIPGYGDVLWIEPLASSSYNALEVRVERPQARGLWLRGAWTWGHSIDDQSAFLASDGNDNTPQDRGPRWEDEAHLPRALRDGRRARGRAVDRDDRRRRRGLGPLRGDAGRRLTDQREPGIAFGCPASQATRIDEAGPDGPASCRDRGAAATTCRPR